MLNLQTGALGGPNAALLRGPTAKVIVIEVVGDRSAPETCLARAVTVGDATALVRSCGRPIRAGSEILVSLQNRVDAATLVDIERAGYIATGTLLALHDVELVEDDEVIARGYSLA